VHKGNIMKFTEGAFRDWGYDEAAKAFPGQTVTEAELSKAGGNSRADCLIVASDYMRAELVPPPYDQHIQELLRSYIRARHGWNTPVELERAIKGSSSLHDDLWSNAVAAARASPSAVTALFVTSLNNMIDLYEARVTVGLYQRIPPAIFASLYLVSLLAMGMVGLRAGLDRSRGLLPAAILVASIMCVMALIASLDDPVSRLFQISQHALDDTERLMKTAPGHGKNAISSSLFHVPSS